MILESFLPISRSLHTRQRRVAQEQLAKTAWSELSVLLSISQQYIRLKTGQGPYAIIYHAGEKVSDRSSHLAYVLEAPAEVGEVQTSFNLAHEGSGLSCLKLAVAELCFRSFGLSVRNPNT